MTKRRPDGDGMVRKRETNKWEGRIVAGHKDDGTPIFKYVYATTQKEVMLKLHQLIEIYRDVELTEDSSMTMKEWLYKWLEVYKSGTIRESTMKSYRHMVDFYILPYIGKKKILEVTPFELQRLYTRLKKSGRVNKATKKGEELSDTMVRSIHFLLHQAMEDAKNARMIPFNPTEKLTIPKSNYKPKTILDDSQLKAFLEEIKKETRWYAFFYTEITTGLRRGEICGLKWSDFDAETGALNIVRTLHAKSGNLIEGDTKTEQGKRKIMLPDTTAELLRMRKATANSQWIFPNFLKPDEPVNPSSAYTELKKILKNAGLPAIRFHDLRHTFATHALTGGVDPKTLSGILGHTNASFTLDTYTHVTGDMQEKAAEIVGDFIGDICGGGI